MEKVHFRLTSVAQKRCWLSSLVRFFNLTEKSFSTIDFIGVHWRGKGRALGRRCTLYSFLRYTSPFLPLLTPSASDANVLKTQHPRSFPRLKKSLLKLLCYSRTNSISSLLNDLGKKGITSYRVVALSSPYDLFRYPMTFQDKNSKCLDTSLILS